MAEVKGAVGGEAREVAQVTEKHCVLFSELESHPAQIKSF